MGVNEDIYHIWWVCPAWQDARLQHPTVLTADRSLWPACLSHCGVMTITFSTDAEHRLAVTASLHLMMTAIICAREAKRAGKVCPTAPTTSSTILTSTPALSAYLWAWDPPGPRLHYRDVLQGVTPPRLWSHGLILFSSFVHYLSSIAWPQGVPNPGITFIELAIDFELATGVDLPCAPRHHAQPPPYPLGDRALMFSHLLQQLSAYLGSPPHAGSCSRKIHSLSLFGIPVGAGITTRPVLLAGAVTESVLQQLHSIPHHHFVEQSSSLPRPTRWTGWADSFYPTYPAHCGSHRLPAAPSRALLPPPPDRPLPYPVPQASLSSPSSPVTSSNEIVQPHHRKRAGSPLTTTAPPVRKLRGLIARAVAVPTVTGPRTAAVVFASTAYDAAVDDDAPRPPKRRCHGRGNPEARER